MPTIKTVRHISGRPNTYEVVIDWEAEIRRYSVAVSETAGIRMLHSKELEADLPRCPTLLKHVGPLVFRLHDGLALSLPVVFGLLSADDVVSGSPPRGSGR